MGLRPSLFIKPALTASVCNVASTGAQNGSTERSIENIPSGQSEAMQELISSIPGSERRQQHHTAH